jgi:phospholipid transport system transporter-binding protein
MIESDIAGRAEPGEFAAVDEGGRWLFTGGLTFDDAARVLEASRELALPATGIVDFAGLHAADSAALAVLMALNRRASHERRRLHFAGLPKGLVALAHVYGIDDLVGVEAG